MTTTGESIQVDGVVYRYRIASKTTATQKNVIEVTVEATNVTEKEQEEVKRKLIADQVELRGDIEKQFPWDPTKDNPEEGA